MLNLDKNVAAIILDELSDQDLFNFCKCHKNFNVMANEQYFRNRTDKLICETIPVKLENSDKETQKTWKQHYLEMSYYIDKLKEYNYVYKKEDENPKLLYKTYLIIPKHLKYEKRRAFVYACERNNFPIVKYLIKRIKNNSLNYGLINACKAGHLNIAEYLVGEGANVHFEDSRCFVVASDNDYLSVVKYLMQFNPDAAEINRALTFACENGHLPVVKYLIERGGNIPQLLFYASLGGHLHVVKYLIEMGADPNSQSSSALKEASEKSHLPIVEYLLQFNPAINDITTALRRNITSSNRSLPVVKLLVEAGANIHYFTEDFLINNIEHNNFTIVQYLIEKGADVNARNDMPLKIAVEKGYIEIENYLRLHGATDANWSQYE